MSMNYSQIILLLLICTSICFSQIDTKSNDLDSVREKVLNILTTQDQITAYNYLAKMTDPLRKRNSISWLDRMILIGQEIIKLEDGKYLELKRSPNRVISQDAYFFWIGADTFLVFPKESDPTKIIEKYSDIVSVEKKYRTFWTIKINRKTFIKPTRYMVSLFKKEGVKATYNTSSKNNVVTSDEVDKRWQEKCYLTDVIVQRLFRSQYSDKQSAYHNLYELYMYLEERLEFRESPPKRLCAMALDIVKDLNTGSITDSIKSAFGENAVYLPATSKLKVIAPNDEWLIFSEERDHNDRLKLKKVANYIEVIRMPSN